MMPQLMLALSMSSTPMLDVSTHVRFQGDVSPNEVAAFVQDKTGYTVDVDPKVNDRRSPPISHIGTIAELLDRFTEEADIEWQYANQRITLFGFSDPVAQVETIIAAESIADDEISVVDITESGIAGDEQLDQIAPAQELSVSVPLAPEVVAVVIEDPVDDVLISDVASHEQPDLNVESFNPPPQWQVYQGESLKTALQRWCADAAWQLIWRADFDYRIDIDHTFDSDFNASLATLRNYYQAMDRPLTLTPFSNQILKVTGGGS